MNVSASFEHEGRRLWAWATVRLGNITPAGVLPAEVEHLNVTDKMLERVEVTPEIQRMAELAVRDEAHRRLVQPADRRGA